MYPLPLLPFFRFPLDIVLCKGKNCLITKVIWSGILSGDRKMEEYDLLQCVDKALDSFGSSVKNAVFGRMTMLHNSSGSEVISDPRMFARVIKETFGDSAKAVEMLIITELRKKFSLSEEGTHSLVQAITEAKEQVIVAYAPNAGSLLYLEATHEATKCACGNEAKPFVSLSGESGVVCSECFLKLSKRLLDTDRTLAPISVS